jgi:alanine racemase
MNYSVQDVLRIIKAEPLQIKAATQSIKDLLIDSRSLNTPALTLYFAIKGKRHNGHQFIRELYDKGVRNFVVSEELPDISELPEANILKVPDTLKALQTLAAEHRASFVLPVIGITGSNGKTIIKEWLYQLLSPDKHIIRSPRSFNSQVGVPLSVWQIAPEHEMAIFEAGISEPDEMDKLQAIIKPTIGLFTNIGHAHDKNFINLAHKAGEKLKLFTRVETLIYCTDYFDIQDRILKTELPKTIGFFTWSRKNKADLKITSVVKSPRQTRINGYYKSNDVFIDIPFTDDASVENAIHCWAVMLYMGYHPSVINERMQQLSPVAMRLEMKEGINRCSIINDSYNSDINSLSIALDFLNQQKQHEKRTLILSDILQSSLDDHSLYSSVASLIQEKGINRLIGIGPNISRQATLFPLQKEFFNDTDDFLRHFNLSSLFDETILLKGARVFEFEQISRVLQQKSHETVLEINLNALVHNLNYYRAKIRPGVKMMAMVKAFSYGSGSFEIANVLQFNHVDYLAVAYADEGVELRKAGITLPIMVMSPEEESLDTLIRYNLEPEVYSMRILELLKEAIRNRSSLADTSVPVHLKLDTGMHRLGFMPAEMDHLIAALRQEPGIKVKSVFSHLATADEATMDEHTQRQITLFSEMGKKLKEALDEPFLMHILNSAGISRFPAAQFDMVRLGIGLYGIGNDSREQQALQNVGTLKSIISQIKEIPAKDSVGYSRKWIAQGPSTIAIIPIGYADGLDRRLGNGVGKVFIDGREAPIIGNICMDMCMVDITGFQAKEGDEVVLFSENYTVKQFADNLGTIPYEVLTSISRRVKRIYYYE